jgi:hypothetical protein
MKSCCASSLMPAAVASSGNTFTLLRLISDWATRDARKCKVRFWRKSAHDARDALARAALVRPAARAVAGVEVKIRDFGFADEWHVGRRCGTKPRPEACLRRFARGCVAYHRMHMFLHPLPSTADSIDCGVRVAYSWSGIPGRLCIL